MSISDIVSLDKGPLNFLGDNQQSRWVGFETGQIGEFIDEVAVMPITATTSAYWCTSPHIRRVWQELTGISVRGGESVCDGE